MIELLVSMAVGLVLLAGMSTLFINQNRTQAGLDRTARLIENGRYAMQVIAGELQVAGYFGELDTSPTAFIPGTVPNACDASIAGLSDAIGMHVQGIDNSQSIPVDWTCIDDVRPGTDVLVIRRVHSVPANAPTDVNNATPYLQVSLCQDDAENTYRLDILPSQLNLRDRTCDAASRAQVRRVRVEIYFVAQNNDAGDGIPTLKRAVLQPTGLFATEALVEGIENLQVEYGIDDYGPHPLTGAPILGGLKDGSPETWSKCDLCTPEDFWRTAAVRVHLLARSLEPTPDIDTKTYQLAEHMITPTSANPNDRFRRQVYSQFVRLNNPAGRGVLP